MKTKGMTFEEAEKNLSEARQKLAKAGYSIGASIRGEAKKEGWFKRRISFIRYVWKTRRFL